MKVLATGPSGSSGSAVVGAADDRRLRPERLRHKALLAAALAAAVSLTSASGIVGLGDTDPYRHLAYARLLWQSGFKLRGHPFLPFTLLGETGVDLWWGFHLLLIPFTFFGTLWGARLAAAAISAVVAGTLAVLLRRLGQPQGWLFALAPFAFSPMFLQRVSEARPAALTVPLLMVALFAGQGSLHRAWAGTAAFAHGLLHLSSPLGPLFVCVGWACARQTRSRGNPEAIVWAVGGLALALLVRPDRALYLPVAVLTNAGALGHIPGGRLPHAAAELFGISPGQLLTHAGALIVLLLVAAALGWRKERPGTSGARLATLAACAITLGLCFESKRFVDYLAPFLALAAGLQRPRLPAATRAARIATWGFCALAALALAFNLPRAWRQGNASIAPPASFEQMAAVIRERVPPGAMIVTEDLIQSGVLWSYVPEYRFPCAYDPSLLYLANEQLFWRWYHAVAEGRECADRECVKGSASAEAVAKAVEAFGSEWFFSFYPRTGFTVLQLLARDRDRFELVGTAPSNVGRLSLWHVKPRPRTIGGSLGPTESGLPR